MFSTTQVSKQIFTKKSPRKQPAWRFNVKNLKDFPFANHPSIPQNPWALPGARTGMNLITEVVGFGMSAVFILLLLAKLIRRKIRGTDSTAVSEAQVISDSEVGCCTNDSVLTVNFIANVALAHLICSKTSGFRQHGIYMCSEFLFVIVKLWLHFSILWWIAVPPLSFRNLNWVVLCPFA